MASPMVAGLAALMVSYNGSANVDDILNCLLHTANEEINDPNSYPGNLPGSLGTGSINAYNALRCIGANCENPLAVIFSNSQTICPNGLLELSTNPGISYLWSTGEITEDITIIQPNIYSVTITFNGGCTASANIDIESANLSAVIIINEAPETSGLDPNDGIVCGSFPNLLGQPKVSLIAWWGESYSWNVFGSTASRGAAAI